MLSKFFWTDWPKPYRYTYLLLLTVLGIALLWTAYAYFMGHSMYFDWQIAAQTEITQVPTESFKIGPFTLSSEVDNAVFTQQFIASDHKINTGSYYTLLIVTAIGASLLIGIISTLRGFWYYLGATIMVLFFVNLKLELVYLFGQEGKFGLILVLLMYLPLTFYLSQYKKEVNLLVRFGLFLALTLILAFIIHFFAEVSRPFFYLATASIINPIVLTIIFILMVSHEIIAFFVYILTRSNGPTSKGTLRHFAVVSLVYMVNLLLAFLHETHVIDWDLIYVNLFLLLGISTLVGIRGFKAREYQYDYLFTFFPAGAIGYAVMAICAFVTIAHFMTTGNDPGLEVFRDSIIYSHLGYGGIFLLYIASNFSNPLKENLKAHKVLYNPTAMPYFTFRLAGLIAVVALTLQANWRVPAHQGISAYYNGLGDLHSHTNEELLAKRYFQEASDYGYNNHKANYQLSQIAQKQKNTDEAIKYAQKATKKWPSPQSYANLSNIYIDNGKFLESLFTLKEGYEKFPDHYALLNNLGVAYGKTDIIDSAVFFLDAAYQSNDGRSAAASNILALIALHDLALNPDSVLLDYKIDSDPISVNNNCVIQNKASNALATSLSIKDSTLSYLDAALLSNQGFNYLHHKTDTLEADKIISLANHSSNINFRDQLKLVASMNFFRQKNINRAFRELNWTANGSDDKGGDFFNRIGLWALKEGAPDVAAQYFEWAVDKNFEDAHFHLAIALSEAGKQKEAYLKWQELSAKSGEIGEIATAMSEVLKAGFADLENFGVSQKYLFSRYSLSYKDTTQYMAIIDQMTDDNYKAQANLDLVEKLWDNDYPNEAAFYYNKISNYKLTDKALYDKIQWFELKMLAASGNIKGLATKINQGVEFDKEHTVERYFYTALINEASNDTTNARKNYEYIAYKNPFQEDATIAASLFIGQSDPFEAYDILLSAIELNPRSIKLLKAYILQCARVELNNYAENSFVVLAELVKPDQLQLHRIKYETLVKQVAIEMDNF